MNVHENVLLQEIPAENSINKHTSYLKILNVFADHHHQGLHENIWIDLFILLDGIPGGLLKHVGSLTKKHIL